ncbi:MAG: energy-coupling factor transporter transmembrane protein EcfT, partial [Deltaproteobacteria bacterium]|jgi:energy-coupling factor transporter transmembrane protein EcfT|nr:energy-coupling factor transporter transmembrane protein EcfT [Deltaproteobacteria bacterium]
MTTLTPFLYRQGNSILHVLDARFKIVLMVMFSLSLLHASPLGLSALTLLLALLFLHIRVPLLSVIAELRYFFILLLVVFTLRLILTKGDPLVTVMWISLSKQGAMEGAMVCWRLLMVVLLGFLFISTTRISAIKTSVQHLLAPVPFIPEKRLATMMGLIVRFIPVIFQKTHDISQAQKARCVELKKNPLYRLESFVMPLMRGVFQDADKLAMAMIARCYHENQPLETLAACKKDWLALASGGLFCILLQVI